jgi:hypothetical protein
VKLNDMQKAKVTVPTNEVHVEKKKPTRCHLMLYCSYEPLYMLNHETQLMSTILD